LTKECKTVVASSSPFVTVQYDGTVKNTGNDEIDSVVVSEQDNATINTSGNPTGTFTPNVASLPLTKAVTVGGVTTYNACGTPCNLAPGETAYFGLNSNGTPGALSYTPSSGTLVDAGRILFGDVVGASGKSKLDGATVPATPKPAACPLCPSGACPL
jgi:hypothetical protein